MKYKQNKAKTKQTKHSRPDSHAHERKHTQTTLPSKVRAGEVMVSKVRTGEVRAIEVRAGAVRADEM